MQVSYADMKAYLEETFVTKTFCKISKLLKAVTCFLKYVPTEMFDRSLNTSLIYNYLFCEWLSVGLFKYASMWKPGIKTLKVA